MKRCWPSWACSAVTTPNHGRLASVSARVEPALSAGEWPRATVTAVVAVASVQRIAVSIRAQDPITRSGLVAQLAYRHEVHIVDADDATAGGVTVVLADEVDDASIRTIRAARIGDENRVVLVVTRLGEGDLLGAVEAGA